MVRARATRVNMKENMERCGGSMVIVADVTGNAKAEAEAKAKEKEKESKDIGGAIGLGMENAKGKAKVNMKESEDIVEVMEDITEGNGVGEDLDDMEEWEVLEEGCHTNMGWVILDSRLLDLGHIFIWDGRVMDLRVEMEDRVPSERHLNESHETHHYQNRIE
jgi:hypothetical protein